MAKIADATQTGAAMAAAIYSLAFAPLGERLGTAGGMLVDAAARSCASSPHDSLAQQFARLIAQESKDAAP